MSILLVILSSPNMKPFLNSVVGPLKWSHVEDVGYDPDPHLANRSEERRVGKECRSRWSPYH